MVAEMKLYSTCHNWGPTGLTTCQGAKKASMEGVTQGPFPQTSQPPLPSQPWSLPQPQPDRGQEYQGSATLLRVP